MKLEIRETPEDEKAKQAPKQEVAQEEAGDHDEMNDQFIQTKQKQKDDDESVTLEQESDVETGKNHKHPPGFVRENRCHTQAYNMHQSTAGVI